MPPGDSTPEKTAPQPLELVQRFVNSIDLESGEDELDNPQALRRWFAERGLMGSRERVENSDLRRAQDVREGLRALLLQNNGLPLRGERVERLDGAAGRAGMRVCFRAGADPELVPQGSGTDAALGRLMAIVADSVADGTWERLKACPREECEWAFYDHSKNRSGRWCKMEDCGNKAKAEAFRKRRRAKRG